MKILKQRDLENKGMKVGMKLYREEVKLRKLETMLSKISQRYEEQEKKTWAISEKLAGIKGLISNCKDGQIEVA